jgi:hypothetical protein
MSRKESDQPTVILNLFILNIRDQALQLLSEFEAIIGSEPSPRGPSCDDFETYSLEQQELARFLLSEAELQALTLAAMPDFDHADYLPMEEGEYSQEQKEY